MLIVEWMLLFPVGYFFLGFYFFSVAMRRKRNWEVLELQSLGGWNQHTHLHSSNTWWYQIHSHYLCSFLLLPNLFSKIESITFSSESNTGRNLLLKSQNTCEWQAGSTTFTARPPAILHHGRTGHKTREVDMETQKWWSKNHKIYHTDPKWLQNCKSQRNLPYTRLESRWFLPCENIKSF